MKKVVGGLVLLGILGIGIYFVSEFFRTPYPERIFPKNTTGYLFLHNRSEIRKQFAKTLVWQQIEKSPRKEIYKRQVDRAMSSLENVTGVDLRPLLSEFTRDIAVGMFPLKGESSGVAFAGYVDDESDVQKFLEQKLDPSLKRRLPDLKKLPVNYKGVTYYKYNSSQFSSKASPSYYIDDHHLVVGYSEDSVMTLLDVKNKDLEPLKKSSLLKDAKREIGYKRGVLLFVDIQGVLNQLKTAIPDKGERWWSSAIRIAGADALHSFSYRIGTRDEGFEEVGFVSVKPDRKGLLKIYLEQPSRKLEAVRAIPPEGKVASAGTLADLAKMWDEVNAQLRDILTPDQFSKWQGALGAMKGFFNFDIRRDLLEPMGDQFGFSYGGEESSDPAKMRYLITVQLRNPDRMLETLNRLTSLAAMQGVGKKEENYQGKKIQVMDLHIGQISASPAFYVEKSWLYFATDYGFLKKSIDAQLKGKAVDSLADYQKMTSGFPSKLNAITYTNVSSCLRMYAAILNRQADNSDSRWIREYGAQEELTALSKSLFGAAAYTQFEKGGIYMYSYASVPRSFLSLPPALSALPLVLGRHYSRTIPVD